MTFSQILDLAIVELVSLTLKDPQFADPKNIHPLKFPLTIEGYPSRMWWAIVFRCDTGMWANISVFRKIEGTEDDYESALQLSGATFRERILEEERRRATTGIYSYPDGQVMVMLTPDGVETFMRGLAASNPPLFSSQSVAVYATSRWPGWNEGRGVVLTWRELLAYFGADALYSLKNEPDTYPHPFTSIQALSPR